MPQLFWSYFVWEEQKEQILWNILAFIPIGLIGGKVASWKIILIGAMVSVSVEASQLFFRLGLFEFDDMIHNTLGTVIGFVGYWGMKRVSARIKSQKQS